MSAGVEQLEFQAEGYHVVRLTETSYAHGRTVVTAVAYKVAAPGANL